MTPGPAHLAPGYTIRAGSAPDIAAWLACKNAQLGDNGEDGIYFSHHARVGATPFAIRRQRRRDTSLIVLPVDIPNWFRLWLAVEEVSGTIVGHATLRGGAFAATMHRATLGTGLLRPHRRRGLGSALVAAATEWGRQQPSLEWVDLEVFSPNLPARNLFRRFGFVEDGHRLDQFRVDNVSIDLIHMTLKVAPALR